MNKKVLLIGLSLVLAISVAVPIATLVGAHTEESPLVVTLYAGQDIDVGNVTVWNEDGIVYVRYQTSGDWVMTETHLDVKGNETDIPQSPAKKGNGGGGKNKGENGNPIPGHFGNQTEHDPSVADFTYNVDVSGLGDDTLAIAAHAEVQRLSTVCIDFEDYDEKDEVSTVSTPNGDVNFYMGNMTNLDGLTIGDWGNLTAVEGEFPIVAEPDTYYDDPIPANYDKIVAFTYDGEPYRDDWVADDRGTGAGGKTLTDPQDSSQTPLMWHAYHQDLAIIMDVSALPAVQSVDLVGIDLDHNEVWHVLYFDTNDILIHDIQVGPGVGVSGDGAAFAIGYSNPAISKIGIWGAMNLGDSSVVGYAFDNICITSVVQEESAWAGTAVGQKPFPGANWATYFYYTMQ